MGRRLLEDDRLVLEAYARVGDGVPTTDQLLARLMAVEPPAEEVERGD